MKKVFYLLILIVAIFTITGCGEKSKDKNATEKGFITVLDTNNNPKLKLNNEDESFQLNEDYVGITSSSIIDNESLGITLTLYVDEVSKDDNNITKKDMIKEYTWGSYKGFTYDDHSDQIKFRAILAETEVELIVLEGSIKTLDIDNSDINLEEVFDGQEVQDFLNTMKFIS